MPRTQGDKNYFTFVKGINTDAGPLTFPENFSKEEYNFDLLVSGSRRKRLGLDFVSSTGLHSLIDAGWEDRAISVHKWEAPGGFSDKEFTILYLDGGLHFYDSTNTFLGSVLTGFFLIAAPKSADIQVATVAGYAVVTHPGALPMLCSYDGTSITFSSITIKERDFAGAEDGVAVDFNPTTPVFPGSDPDDGHAYNLMNAGWKTTHAENFYTWASGPGWPAKNQSSVLGKTGSGFNPSQLGLEEYLGNTPAPKGHFILDTFDKLRQTVLANDANNVSSPKWAIGTTYDAPVTEFSEKLFCSTAAFVGRVFYSGSSHTDLAGKVYFSKVISGNTSEASVATNLGQCYQEADPTSNQLSDIVATDGGVITIANAGVITKMVPLGASLLCFSANGVWAISGGQDAIFKATEFKITQISSLGIAGPNSAVSVGGKVMYMGVDGIYEVFLDPKTFQIVSKSVTKGRLQTLLNNIPTANRDAVRSVYDPYNNKVYFSYFSGTLPDLTAGGKYTWLYDRMLIYDTLLDSFSTYRFATTFLTTPHVAAMYVSKESYQATGTYNDETHKHLNILAFSPDAGANSSLRPCTFTDTSFKDWATFDGGTQFPAVMTTGHETVGDPSRKKQATYIQSFFNKTETGVTPNAGGGNDLVDPSGCTLVAKWDFSDNVSSGKETASQQVYKYNRNYISTDNVEFTPGTSAVISKTKIRGSGKALQLEFTADLGKDCWLLGWSMELTGVSKR